MPQSDSNKVEMASENKTMQLGQGWEGAVRQWRCSTSVLGLVIFAALLSIFLMAALSRMIARDEGFYLVAAKLLLHGMYPYSDFFYPQMPGYAYLFSGWFLLTEVSWLSARILCALLATGVGCLVAYAVGRTYGREAALAAVVMIAAHSLVVPWYTIAKPYAAAVFCLLVAYIGAGQGGSRGAFVSGAAIGAAALLRLHFVLLLPLVCLHVAIQDPRLWRSVLVGFCVALVPALFHFIISPESFWFNNVGYHLLRSELTWDEAFSKKLRVVEVLLGLREARIFDSFQLLVLLGGLSLIHI